jgi:hypothetical protein
VAKKPDIRIKPSDAFETWERAFSHFEKRYKRPHPIQGAGFETILRDAGFSPRIWRQTVHDAYFNHDKEAYHDLTLMIVHYFRSQRNRRNAAGGRKGAKRTNPPNLRKSRIDQCRASYVAHRQNGLAITKARHAAAADCGIPYGSVRRYTEGME